MRLQDCQEKLEGIDMKLSNYYIVDVNDFTEEELLNEDTLISKVMLLEKAKNSEEIEYFLKKIIPKIKNKDKDKEVVNRIISIILSAKLDKNKIDELIKELKGDDEKMLAVMEMLEKENQMYINIGKKERKKRNNISTCKKYAKRKFINRVNIKNNRKNQRRNRKNKI